MKVLALSQNFLPSAIVPWERALTLIYGDKVEALVNSEKIVRSPSTQILVPEIIRFKKGGTRKKRAIKFSRDSIYLRDNGCCQYCGSRVSREDFTYDHVLPRLLGGMTTWQNVVVSCIPCNQKKGCRTLEQSGMRLRKAPVKPNKLPSNPALALVWRNGMPTSWKQFMSAPYWDIELEP